MIGQTLGHYRILKQIGAGGMGVVYRAHDERLDRDIAIKVLPPGALADEAARKRFRKEALALAKLNHPNIETVHDFDTQDGTDFLGTEYIPGVTLDEKLAERPLSEKEILTLGKQLADGLAAAHEQGVVHRDLKPANLRITPDGRLKILDFGLAKLLQPMKAPEATASIGETRGVIGTVPYMAPEQLRGEAIDARTDIWALGVVLYEMATGRRPFTAEIGTLLADDILHRLPPPPSTVNHHVSPGLESIILKALEKNPERRYQSARDLVADFLRLSAPSGAVLPARPRRRYGAWLLAAGVLLVAVLATLWGLNLGGVRERLLGRAGPPQIHSLAVLPLENLSRDPEQEYFVDGMTEALITELAKISTLRVISRQSVMQFKGTNKPLPEIARQLRVDALVEGSAMREGDRVRITAQLIQALPEQHLWAESYQRELRDVLRLQGEIARTIAYRIQAKVVSGGATSVTAIPPVNPQAYDGYLRARYNISRSELQATLQAVEYLQETIRLSPDFAPAHAALADAYFMLGQPLSTGSAVEARQYFSQAEAAARKALELDDSLAEAHSRLGQILLFRDWDWNAARRETERALELDPNSLFALYAQGIQLTMMGRYEASRPFMRRALERDPANVMTGTLAAELLLYARQYDAAETELRRVLEMDPEYARAHAVAVWLYELRGQGEEAADAYAKSGALGSEDAASLARAFRATGMRGFYTWWVRLLEKRENQKDSAAINAHFYAGLGDRERALQQLEKAFQEHDSNLLFCKINPWLDPLRGDPRFQDLLRRMNFPR